MRMPSIVLNELLLVALFLCAAASPAHAGAHGAWLEPPAQAPGLEYRTFHSRIADRDVSYHVFVPQAYRDNPATEFPVMYWLHGSNGGSEHLPVVVSIYSSMMDSGLMPPMLIVFPNGLKDSMWVDSADGETPVESVIVKELIPEIDRNYRTIPKASARMIEGFSMGGFGAAHLALKYPRQFGAVSMLAAGPMVKSLLSGGPPRNARGRAHALSAIFGGDDSRFARESPWHLAKEAAAAVKANGMKIRIADGDEDAMLPYLKAFSEYLTTLGIRHEFTVIEGVGHSMPGLFAHGCMSLTPFYREFSPRFRPRDAMSGASCPVVRRPYRAWRHHQGSKRHRVWRHAHRPMPALPAEDRLLSP